MLFITLMTKCLIQRKRSTNTIKLSEAEQGATAGDAPPHRAAPTAEHPATNPAAPRNHF